MAEVVDELTRIPPEKVSPLGLFNGQIKMADDFDDPLPEFEEYT
jgi:hypothetical protein